MEDLPDKLRRNVVVLAAAIVAITVFHLSFKPTGTLLGFAQVGNVTPLKVWLALTAVLIYVFLRYWFHEDTDRERALLAQEFQGRRYAAIKRHLERSLERYVVRQRTPDCLTDFDNLAEERLEQFAQRGPVRKAFAVATLDVDKSSPWRGGVRFNLAYEWADNHAGPSPLRRYAFQLSNCFAVWTVARCALRTATYSKSAVDTLVPIGLAALAFGMCVFQLVMAGVKP